MLLATLAACGGGGNADVEAQLARASARSKPITISNFSPTSARAGDTVTVNGNALNTVTYAKIGAAAADFVVVSAKRLRLTVPAGAVSARIEVGNDGASAQSSSDLVISSSWTATSVSPDTVFAPARVTVSGTGLDAIRRVTLNGTVLAIAAQSAASLALDVPAGAASGTLTLVDASGAPTPTTLRLTVATPMSIAGFSPASVARGATLTVTGAGLDRATSVEFAGASAPIASRSGSTSLAVSVPATASSGPITVVGNLGDRVTSSASVTIVVPIVVDANANYRLASVPASLTVAGSGLLSVSGVTVGTTAAAITSKTDAAITFTVPAGISCAPITLLSGTQPAAAAGTVTVGAGCAARSAGVEFAQVLSQTTADGYQRLVPRKTTLVRAYVVSDVAGTPAPTVRLTGYSGGAALGTISMTGPATLPLLASGAALPDSLRYDETQTFNASLPSSWVGAGLSVRIDIGGALTVDATPAMGTSTRIDLVLVPLVSGPYAPQMPNVSAVVDELSRRLTLPRESIGVSIRAAYAISATADGVDTSTEWSNVLAELDQLRRREAPNKHYYGMIRPMVSAGIAGIGYVNRVGSSSPYLSAVGWDASRSSWTKTMTHELGHNFSRSHAPCGGVASPDPNYPYAGGVLSPTPLYESLLGDVLSPANQYDIMGYCGGTWFSDYNLREVQRFMEAQPQAATSVAGSSADVAGDLIVLSGRIDAEGASIDPVQRTRGAAAAATRGDYRLRLTTQAGAAVEVPVDAVEVDHVDEKHFYAVAPAPGPLARVDVLRGGVAIPLRGGRMRAQSATSETKAGPSVQWAESGGLLQLSWNASDFATAALTHVAADGRRTVLALNLTGGDARIDVSHLPRGGEFELSLSSGLDARLLILAR